MSRRQYVLKAKPSAPPELSARAKVILDRGTIKVTEKGHLFKLESINKASLPPQLEGIRRSDISEFSRQSRTRLIREVCSYGRLVPIFITLTYGADYPDPIESKAHLKAFWRKIAKAHPDYWAVWKLEFQKRGAPHYHLLIYTTEGKPRIPKAFISSVWAMATGRPELEKTGTKVESLRSHRGGVWYATKYLCKEETFKPSKDDGDPAASEESARPGRFWGILSRKNRPKSEVTYQLSPSEYKMLLSEIIKAQAAVLVAKDYMNSQPLTWDEALCLATQDAASIEEKGREIVKNNRVPTHLMSDEHGLIRRISMMAQSGYCDYYPDKFFDQLG